MTSFQLSSPLPSWECCCFDLGECIGLCSRSPSIGVVLLLLFDEWPEVIVPFVEVLLSVSVEDVDVL